MNRRDFEHLIAAASQVVGEDELVVIGSQAILGTHPEAPPELLRSMEADIYPHRTPAKADLVDGALGDGSIFHAQYGYYAHGVGPQTAKAPDGWTDRLVAVPIPPRVGSQRRTVALCMEVHDLVLAKLAAGRERDWDFARICVEHDLCDPRTLCDRARRLPVADAQIDEIVAWAQGQGP